jgi:hypothetical protein
MGELDFNDQISAGKDRNIAYMKTAININSVNVYQLMTEAYYGTGGFRNGNYLIPFSRESDYNSRKQLAHYKNYVRPIIRAMVEPVFSEVAPRVVNDGEGNNAEVDNMFKTFLDDVDTTGTSMQDYSHSALKVCRRHGIVFTVMDNFSSEDQPETLQQANQDRIMPYIYMKQADEVEDYLTDRFGNLEWIIFKESPEIIKGKKELRWRRWTKTTSEVLTRNKVDNSFVSIDVKDHNLGIVPVIKTYSDIPERKDTLLVDPPLYDIARLNYVIYNQSAEIRDQERAQAFSVFYAQGLPDGDTVLGTSNFINLDYQVTIAPGYASPDFNIIAGLVDNQEQIRKDLFLIAEQAGVIGVENSESGISKAYDFFAHEDTLKRTSIIATDMEYKISDLFKLYTGEEYDYTVDYPHDFAPMGLDREIDRFDKIFKMPDINPLLKSRLQEKLARVLFADEERSILDEIIQDIRDNYEKVNQPKPAIPEPIPESEDESMVQQEEDEIVSNEDQDMGIV